MPVVITTKIITVTLSTMRSGAMRKHVFVAVMAMVVTVTTIFAVQLALRDWQYFVLEKQFRQWRADSPPVLADIISVGEAVKYSGDVNPNFLRLYAWVLEWKAFIDANNARFYLHSAEESLEKSLLLRPTDSRSWAHLATVKEKLFIDSVGVNAAAKKAIMLGSGDQQTNYILSKLKTH